MPRSRTALSHIACLMLLLGTASAEAGSLKILHRFSGPDGSNPRSGLTAVAGALYGTTDIGGRACGDGCGTVYALNTSGGQFRIVYAFQGYPNDGYNPQGSLVGVGSKLFGTTTFGGTAGSDSGTVFSVSLSGAETILSTFANFNDGIEPATGLTRIGQMLYGTTSGGGAGDVGTIFSLDPRTATERLVHAFGSGADGRTPLAGLLSVGNTLYGTTFEGGSSGNCTFGCGTVFSVDAVSGAEKIIYSFQGGGDGTYPASSLIEVGGMLYGTTSYGGRPECVPFGCGTVFALDPKTGAKRILHAFTGGADGAVSQSGLTNLGGVLYGEAFSGLSAGQGSLFALDPATGAFTTAYTFQGGSDGADPVAGLVAVGGKLYGTTYHGGGGSKTCGYEGCGTVFQYTP